MAHLSVDKVEQFQGGRHNSIEGKYVFSFNVSLFEREAKVFI